MRLSGTNIGGNALFDTGLAKRIALGAVQLLMTTLCCLKIHCNHFFDQKKITKVGYRSIICNGRSMHTITTNFYKCCRCGRIRKGR